MRRMRQLEKSLLAAFDYEGARPPTRGRLQLLLALEEKYAAAQVVAADGTHLPLWHDCRNAGPCWRRVPAHQRPRGVLDPSADGGMPLPWIGAKYSRGGLLTLGINLREASGRMIEYIITDTPDGQIDFLSRGRKKPHGSMFAYNSTRAAAAVLRSQAGAAELDVDEPEQLAVVLDQITRLQGVKCSPEDHARSARSAEMRRLCPPTYLPQELGILRPGTVIAFGLESWWALDRNWKIHIEEAPNNNFVRGRLQVADQRMELFWLSHPSAPSAWPAAFESLLASLRNSPAG